MLKKHLYFSKQSRVCSLQLVYLTLLFIPLNNFLFAQIQNCQNVYVWDFKLNDSNKDASIAVRLTDEVEDILSEFDSCIILQRRKYGDIKEQVRNELNIIELEDMPKSVIDKFHLISAEYVIFATIDIDFNFNVNIRIRIESLLKKTIKTKTIYINSKNFISQSSRKEAIKKGLSDLLNLKYLPLKSNLKISESLDDSEKTSNLIEEDEINQLITVLEIRAERIKSELSNHYYFTNTEEIVKKFDILHNKHIVAIRKGNLLEAHEILKEIYSLSERLEIEEFKKARKKYCFGCNYSPFDEYYDYHDLLFKDGYDHIYAKINFTETQKYALKKTLNSLLSILEQKFENNKLLRNSVKRFHSRHLKGIEKEDFFIMLEAIEQIQRIEKENSKSIEYQIKGIYTKQYLNLMETEIIKNKKEDDLETRWRQLYYIEMQSQDKYKNGILINSYLIGVFRRRILSEVSINSYDTYISILNK